MALRMGRLSPALLLATVAAAGTLNVGTAALPTANADTVAHVAQGACAQGLQPLVKDDRTVPAQWKDPASLVFGLGDAAKANLPQAIGPVPAGPVWMIGSTQQAGVPWLGANTQHPDLLSKTSGQVTWELAGFEGPGAMAVFTQGGLGQVVGEQWFTAGNGAMQGRHTIPANSHVHPSWVFSKPGTYKVTIRQTTTSKGGEKLTGQATLTFNVGGSGNANEGHFDFGSAPCSKGGSAGGSQGGQKQAAGQQGQQAQAQNLSSGSSSKSAGKATSVAAKPASNSTAGGGEQTCTAGIVPRVKDDRTVPAQWKDPASLVFGLGDAAKANLPQAIGPVPAGPVWMIGSTQQAGVPWLGGNTQHPSLLENTKGDVTWDIAGFEGPGAMAVFTQGGLGQVVGEQWFTAADGKAQGSHTIPANSHVHPSWVFSKPGAYKVTVRQTTTAKGGEKLTGQATLTFNVGGSGNANEGHFDFGTVFDPKGSCSSGGAGAAGGATGGGEAAEGGAEAVREGSLAETGTTVMTLPFAVLGLGILVFGAGLVFLDARLRSKLLTAVGARR
ncbi:TIGR03773 family transporter-associated surface protein [Corynebacterium liangguodongii]|nr:TIGR03773 family transporter-associated surface protein [Corynebacterium liangguodongii]